MNEKLKEFFNKKLLTAAAKSISVDQLTGGIEYETMVCPTCGHEEYVAKPGQEEKFKKAFPLPDFKGKKIRFKRP